MRNLIIVFFLFSCFVAGFFLKPYLLKTKTNIYSEFQFDSLSREYEYKDSLYQSFIDSYYPEKTKYLLLIGEYKQEIENYAIENRSLLRELNSCKNNQNYQVISPICH